jgi:hypothetical protein
MDMDGLGKLISLFPSLATFSPFDHKVASTLTSLGHVLRMREENESARMHLQRVLEIKEVWTLRPRPYAIAASTGRADTFCHFPPLISISPDFKI